MIRVIVRKYSVKCDGCDLLVAADCAAVACETFQECFRKGRLC